MLKRLLALALLLILIAPAFVVAQDDGMPPLPRPRPDHDTGTTVPGTEGETAATEAITALTSVPQPVTLLAQVTEGGATIPEGLVWRVFDTKTDDSGQLALVAKSDEATANITLPPGEYVVHVAYGRAQASDSLTVAEGANNKTIVLDAGALRLNAAITGDVAIPIALLKFDIFSNGSGTGSDRTLIAEAISANDIVTLNAGTYHVVSYFGDINATVRADLRVEPGQLTDATLFHKGAQVAFKLVSDAGGEAIADVDWTVKTADGTTVFTDLGAFPETVLAEGDYLVLAKRGETVFNREFEVQPGPAEEIEVLTTVY